MTEPAVISVRRQIVDVELQGTQSDGLALQHRLPRVCADTVSPALERALAALDPGDGYVSIERLEITVADIRLDRLEQDLAEAVQREVALYVRANPPVASEDGGNRAGPDAASGPVRRRSRAETVDEALVVFLRSGRLPWSFQLPPGSPLEQLALDVWNARGAERGPPPSTLARLFEVLRLPDARRRLLSQFTPRFASRVLTALSPSAAAAAEQALRELAAAEPSAASSSWSSAAPMFAAFAREVWDAALSAATEGVALRSSDLVRSAWLRSAHTQHAKHTKHDLVAFLEQRWPGTTERDAASPSVEPSITSSRMPSPTSVADEDAAEGIVVDNAGSVLLHPFLPHYFEGLGVAVGGELTNPNRAMCLLHHLATGEVTAPEHRLVLAKVLCAVALDEPVEADVGLTEAEQDESIALLEAAIRHWGALRGSSPDALRAEFLTRAGTLSVDADGDWLLRVAAETADILLDQLPWSISLVKLPWMPRPLRVEWR
jgi:hypothetical protein